MLIEIKGSMMLARDASSVSKAVTMREWMIAQHDLVGISRRLTFTLLLLLCVRLSVYT